jgi:hypothetical protein
MKRDLPLLRKFRSFLPRSLGNPRQEIERKATNKDADPQNQLGPVYHHSEDIYSALEN